MEMPKLGRRAAFVALWRAIRAARRPGSPGVAERIRALPRMLAERARGRYTGLSWGRLGLVAIAIGYVLSPIDVVPDLLFATGGLLDDTVVLIWATGVLLDETERYLAWERERGSVVEGAIAH